MNNNFINIKTNSQILWITTTPLIDKLDSATILHCSRRLINRGWNVIIVCPIKSQKLNVNESKLYYIQIPDIYFLRQIIFHAKLFQFILKCFDTTSVVIFESMSLPCFILLKFIRSLHFRRSPLFIMDTRTLFMGSSGKISLKDKVRLEYHNLMNLLANWLADGRTAITQRMVDSLHIPAHKVWGIWPSGVDVELFLPAQQKRQWPKSGEDVKLIYVGCFDDGRNLGILSRAVMEAQIRGMNFTLSLIGKGEEGVELQKLAEQSSGVICVVPPVPHQEIPDLLGQAHVGVLPFPDEEKFRVSSPIKLFEYMASGLPVLATRIACHTDVLRERDCVFWSEGSNVECFLETLYLIWQRRFSLSAMGKKSALAARGWTWQDSAKKLEKAIEYGLRRIHKVRRI
jgi:glycosyltransferase involved in cell wall biosynthesis